MSLTDSLEHHAPAHHGGAPAFLHKQYGPLNGGEWAAVIVAGVLLGLYIKKHGALGIGGPAATPGAPDPGTGLDVSQGAAPIYADPNAAPSNGAPTTNDAWSLQAIELLIKHGIPAHVAQPAIVHFLNGEPLDAAELSAVELAINLLGPPPEGAPALVEAPTPAAIPLPPPPRTGSPVPATIIRPAPGNPTASRPAPAPAPATRRYTVVPGDTLSAIGARFGVAWPLIYQTNIEQIEAAAKAHGLANSGGGHWIYPGEVLVIP